MLSSRIFLVALVCVGALVSVSGFSSSDSLQPTPATFAELTAETEQTPGRVSPVIRDALSDDFSEASMRARFNQLKAARKKPYVSKETEEKAFRAFYKNRLKVRELNAKFSKPGQQLFTSSGKFADLEAEEFAAKFLTYRSPRVFPAGTPPATAVIKVPGVKNPHAGGGSAPAKVPKATATAAKPAKRVRNPNAGGGTVAPTPGSAVRPASKKRSSKKTKAAAAAAPKTTSSKTTSSKTSSSKTTSSKKIKSLKTRTAKSNAKSSLLEVSADPLPCEVPDANGIKGVLRAANTNLDDCAKDQKWEASWADLTRVVVDGQWCCVPAKKADIIAKCTLRGGKCGSNIRTAGNVCEGNEGHFWPDWEGHCPFAEGTNGVQERSWCCIGAKTPPPAPPANGCTDSVNGVRGVLMQSGSLTDCATQQKWPAAWMDPTRDAVKGSWCCVPSTPAFIISHCTSKGGLCGTNKRTAGNACEGNGGKFVAEWDGYCPVGTSVADGPSASAWCCVGGKPEQPPPATPQPDAQGNTYLIDYRAATGKTTPVKDQGQCGSCWAHAATEALESASIWAGHPAQILSPQAIMDCRATKPTSSCAGGFFTDAFTQWKTSPAVLLSQYPYTMKTQDCIPTVGTGPKVKEWGWATARCPGGTCEGLDENQLLTSLKNYGPLAVTIDATSFQHYRGGILPAASCNKTLDSLDHAVALVGYGVDSSNNKFWLVRNSWGADWGEHGYVRMEFGKNACGIASSSAYVVAV